MRLLKEQFDAEMLNIFHRAREEAGYTASLFFNMLIQRGGLETAKYLIGTDKPSDGYTALYLKGRLDLTVEAVIYDNLIYHGLFTSDELNKIKRRLKAFEYPPAQRST